MVSTGYFIVVLLSNENQMESVVFTVRLYLPNESVSVPLPDELSTATASMGLRAEISYTVPLMVTKGYVVFCWANAQTDNNTNKANRGSLLFKLINWIVILKPYDQINHLFEMN